MRKELIPWLVMGYALAVVVAELVGVPGWLARLHVIPWAGLAAGLGGWLAYENAARPWRIAVLAGLLAVFTLSLLVLRHRILEVL